MDGVIRVLDTISEPPYPMFTLQGLCLKNLTCMKVLGDTVIFRNMSVFTPSNERYVFDVFSRGFNLLQNFIRRSHGDPKHPSRHMLKIQFLQ